MGNTDPHDTDEYRAFVAEQAKHCRCCRDCTNADIPCAGVLAGGVCDEVDPFGLCTTAEVDGYDEDDDPQDDFDPLACPGCGGNCQTACR
jgi:hypothetical protein